MNINNNRRLNNSMKRKLIALISVVTFAVVIAVLFFSGCYLPWQTVNENNVGFKTRKTIEQELLSTIPEEINVQFCSENYSLPTYLFVKKELDEDTLKQSFIAWVSGNPIICYPTLSFDENILQNLLSEKKIRNVDANIVFENNTWQLVPERIGLQFDEVEVSKRIMQALEDRETEVDCIDLQILPEVVTTDLVDDFDKVAWLNDWQFTYQDGSGIYGYELSEFVDNYRLKLPENYIEDFVSELHSRFDTTTDSYTFTTPDGETSKTVPYKTFGLTLKDSDEVEAINEALDSKISVTMRAPSMSGYEDIGDDKILISIDDQHIWVYFDGDLWNESDVVTGRQNVHDTPTGVFYITECINGKYLRGADYKTWVNKWMRLTNSGIGLHDATWRSSFGGNIYTYNGSHGCINLPKKFAYDLYEHAYVGLPVIIY